MSLCRRTAGGLLSRVFSSILVECINFPLIQNSLFPKYASMPPLPFLSFSLGFRGVSSKRGPPPPMYLPSNLMLSYRYVGKVRVNESKRGGFLPKRGMVFPQPGWLEGILVFPSTECVRVPKIYLGSTLV